MPVSYAELFRVIAEEVSSIKLGEIAPEEVTEDHHLWVEDGEPNLRLDSLDIFELIYRVESRTSLTFTGIDLMAAATVRELVGQLTDPPPV